MSYLTEKQKNIFNLIPGNWEAKYKDKDKQIEIKLLIGTMYNPSRIIWKENGKEILNEEFDAPHDFFGDYLVEGPYVIDCNRTTNDILIFGLLDGPNLAATNFKRYKRVTQDI